MSREDAGVVGATGEEVGQFLGVIVAVRVVKHVAVKLNTLSHFDLGELGAHGGMI